jgi:hypothetical protein
MMNIFHKRHIAYRVNGKPGLGGDQEDNNGVRQWGWLFVWRELNPMMKLSSVGPATIPPHVGKHYPNWDPLQET